MSAIRIVPDESYRGEGISEGLARGLLVFHGLENLTGEGMGIGSVAFKTDRCTYFSRTFEDRGEDPVHFTRTFLIDTKMSWSFRGNISPSLTRWIEAALGLYMRLPHFQKALMAPAMPLRKLLMVHPAFETVPLLAQVRFTYTVDRSGVRILVQFDPVSGLPGILCILNELSSHYFTSGWERGEVHPPPPGWECLPDRFPTPSLCDTRHGIRFWIDSLSVTPAVPVKIFRGQETGEDVSWAGISFEVAPSRDREPFEIRYNVGFAEDVSS